MPIFSRRDKDGNLSVNLMTTDGIPQFSRGLAVRLVFDTKNDRLSIEPRIGKNQPVYLNCNQIIAIQEMSSTQILEKNKSVVGRAAIGGILLGPLGAIVGGMSGIGAKEKQSAKFYLVLNYHPMQNPNETNVISFEEVGASLHIGSFIKAVRQRISPEIQIAAVQNL